MTWKPLRGMWVRSPGKHQHQFDLRSIIPQISKMPCDLGGPALGVQPTQLSSWSCGKGRPWFVSQVRSHLRLT